jgi:hypothetical protein
MNRYNTIPLTHSSHIFPKTVFSVIAIQLLISLSFYLFVTVFFIHSHQLSDGRIVIHSHLYHHDENSKDHPKNNHQHSSSEFFVYSILTFFKLPLFLSHSLFALLISTNSPIYDVIISSLISYLIIDFPLRAPPDLIV